MTENKDQASLIFPPWIDDVVKLLGIGGGFGTVYLVMLVTFGFSPKTTDVGYAPEQPVPYSHKLHVGELGLDCRYCHSGVEVTAHAGVPPTQTCMNCHHIIRKESELLQPVRNSYATGQPVDWVRVHDVADFAYFVHSAHVQRGVGCVSCHGRVDKMEVVYQDQPLSMGWCLDCHRNPEEHLRPLDKITDLAWPSTEEEKKEQAAYGQAQLLERGLVDQDGKDTWIKRRLTSCSTCHR